MNKTSKIDYSKLLTSLSVLIIIALIIAIIITLLNCKCGKPSEQYKLPFLPNSIPKPLEVKDAIKKKSILNLDIPDSVIDELANSVAAQKLKRNRPAWENSPGFIENKQDNIFESEYNWTDGAAGFSQMDNTIIICGNNREELVVARMGDFGSIGDSLNRFRANIILVAENGFYGPRPVNPPGQFVGARVYTKFGQGCQYSWTISKLSPQNRPVIERHSVYLAPILRDDGIGVDLAMFKLRNNSLVLFDIQPLSNFARSAWVTVDPISQCLFACFNYDNTNLSFSAESFGIYNIEALQDGMLRLSGLNHALVNDPIMNCTGGCFSENGILYLLNNDDDQSGFSAYEFKYNRFLPGYVFNKMKNYRVLTPEESIWSSDNQDLVGIGYFKFANAQPFLGILHRNEDVNIDNITYTRARGLM